MSFQQAWVPDPRLDLEGSGFMRIENYQGILEFTEQRLKLKMKGMTYEVQGAHLMVRGVTKREIFVEGEIHALQITREETP